MKTPPRLIRFREGKDRSAMGTTAVYEAIKRGTWPRQIKIGTRASGFIEAEVDAVLAARAAGWTDDRIRDLVQQLYVGRSQYSEVAMAAPAGLGAGAA